MGKENNLVLLPNVQGTRIRRRDMEHVTVWFRNALTFHHRVMARFLRNRGWVVFYLPEESRECKDVCWMKLARQV